MNSIGDSEDPLERMLGLLRWYLTKDLKLIVSKYKTSNVCADPIER